MTTKQRLGLALWAAGMALAGGARGQDSIWALQAVDAAGKGTHPKVDAAPVTENRVVIEGIALNRSDELLAPEAMWQVYVQTEPPDQGGIAAWAGIFYNSDWPRYPEDINPGDRVRLEGFVANHQGKVNINERHSAAPEMQFTVSVLEQDVGMPSPIPIPNIAACNFFDSSRSGGGELYQAQWVCLSEVQIDSGTWAAGQSLVISDVSGATMTLLLSGQGDFDSYPAPWGTFSVRAIFDQEDASEPYHHHYRLWVKNYGDLTLAAGLAGWEAFR